MKKHTIRRIHISLLCALAIAIIGSIVPASAETTASLSLSNDFLMVQVASGHTPLTASLPNVIWSSSDYMTAQYVPEFGGVTASI